MAVSDWSLTADNNQKSDPNINWREGQPPSSVNNSARAMMAAIKAAQMDMSAGSGCGGTANALVFYASQMPSSNDPYLFAFAPPATNTGATTIKFGDAGTPIPLRRISGTELIPGQITAGRLYLATRNGANEVLLLTDALNLADVTAQIAQAVQTSEAYAQGVANTAQNNAQNYAQNAANNAQNNASSHADSVASAAQNNAQNYAQNAANNAQNNAIGSSNSYTNQNAWLRSQHGFPVEVLRRIDGGLIPTPANAATRTPGGAFLDGYNYNNTAANAYYYSWFQYFRQDVGWVTITG